MRLIWTAWNAGENTGEDAVRYYERRLFCSLVMQQGCQSGQYVLTGSFLFNRKCLLNKKLRKEAHSRVKKNVAIATALGA